MSVDFQRGFPFRTGALHSLFSPPPLQTFRSLVDRVGLGSVIPVQFFGNGNFEFLPESKSLQKFEVCCTSVPLPPAPYKCLQLVAVIV